uniref:Pyrroline-5-carboxylate reductase dimerisation domain-containing protein n=1 Tax=Capra hircus TaxID=9925 RepID=A0A452EML3_CAPHI
MRMPSGLAHRLAAQTLLGTAKRLLHKGPHPAQLRRDVCMPSGSTVIHRLRSTGSTLRTAARSTVEVEAAICRSRKLGM